jgi:branched-subunit amino acid aminotransferase/4-amino-4-deoxychorismate lyase
VQGPAGGGAALPHWVDGRLVAAETAGIPGDDLAYQEGLGCYTSARWCGGGILHAARHAQRLVRDAGLLGLTPPDPQLCLAAMLELGQAAFRSAAGVVRLQASVDARGRQHLAGVPRPLGEERAVWRALKAPFAHPGPSPWSRAKASGQLHLAFARRAARSAGVEEALLFDLSARLVEGSRTSLFVVCESGRLLTPPLERGGVAGIAREIVLARVAAAEEADISADQLARCRELIAVNAVRGARSVVSLDATPTGVGSETWTPRLARILASES